MSNVSLHYIFLLVKHLEANGYNLNPLLHFHVTEWVGM